jgi:hypothetical protein
MILKTIVHAACAQLSELYLRRFVVSVHRSCFLWLGFRRRRRDFSSRCRRADLGLETLASPLQFVDPTAQVLKLSWLKTTLWAAASVQAEASAIFAERSSIWTFCNSSMRRARTSTGVGVSPSKLDEPSE